MSDVINKDVVTMKQFADMLVCDYVGTPQHQFEIEVEMKILGLERIPTETDSSINSKLNSNGERVVSRYLHRCPRAQYLIPPNSKTDPESILNDYAQLFADKINRCVKDNGIKKLYLREVSFKHFKECISEWTVVQVFVRLSFGIDIDDESKLAVPINNYFQGFIHGE
jgi:hypothetical protein